MVVASTGFFDGVHLGHRVVLEELCSYAKEHNMRSMVISFWPHPRIVLQQDAHYLKLLTALDEKQRLIREIGVDEYKVIPFTQDLSKLSTEEFMKSYLKDQFGVSSLVLGYDHRMGRKEMNEGDNIIPIANRLGMDVKIVAEELCDNSRVSSTIIRSMLRDGDVVNANKLLGYNYLLRGVVVLGNQIGRTIGFPTANIQLYEPRKQIPAHGVYEVRVVVDGATYNGITNIGVRPTFSDKNNVSIETYILDFDEYIYGMDFSIEFIRRIRPEIKFDSVEKLKEQLNKDRRCVEESL